MPGCWTGSLRSCAGTPEYFVHMARVKITVPDGLLNRAQGAGLSISQLAARALSDELSRRSKLAAFDVYLADLRAKLGSPSAEEEVEADEWAHRVLGPERTPLA